MTSYIACIHPTLPSFYSWFGHWLATCSETKALSNEMPICHDDVIKWKHFPRYWPFVRGIHRSPVNSPHKGQWRGALIFSLFCTWINAWVNNREAGDLRRHHAQYDVIVMFLSDAITSTRKKSFQPASFHQRPYLFSQQCVKWQKQKLYNRVNDNGITYLEISFRSQQICFRIVSEIERKHH